MTHKVAAWGATFQLLLTVTFLLGLCVFWRRDRTNFLSFFFLSFFLFSSFLSLSLSLSVFLSLPFSLSSEFNAMKNHWTENWWEQNVLYPQKFCRHPGFLTSLYQNVSTVGGHFPSGLYSYITSAWIFFQKRLAGVGNGHWVWTSPHYELRSLRSYISARDSGPQDSKKYRESDKIPTRRWASSKADEMNSFVIYKQMFHSAVLFHAFDISGFKVYLGVNKH